MKTVTLDPSKLTPDELYEHIQGIIEMGYKELPMYIVVVSDILTQGISQFALEQAKARQWSNRLLGLLQEIRQLSSHVVRLAKGKQRLFENAMAIWLRDARDNSSLPKGIDATERKSLARLANERFEQDYEQWTHLAVQVKDYIQHLNDKLEDLENAKQELRSQLWAVKVHGVLGEFAEGKGTSFGKDPVFEKHPNGNSNGTRSEGPPEVPPVSVDPELDALLGE